MTATVGSEEFDVEATERARSERERERQRRGTPVVRRHDLPVEQEPSRHLISEPLSDNRFSIRISMPNRFLDAIAPSFLLRLEVEDPEEARLWLEALQLRLFDTSSRAHRWAGEYVRARQGFKNALGIALVITFFRPLLLLGGYIFIPLIFSFLALAGTMLAATNILRCMLAHAHLPTIISGGLWRATRDTSLWGLVASCLFRLAVWLAALHAVLNSTHRPHLSSSSSLALLISAPSSSPLSLRSTSVLQHASLHPSQPNNASTTSVPSTRKPFWLNFWRRKPGGQPPIPPPKNRKDEARESSARAWGSAHVRNGTSEQDGLLGRRPFGGNVNSSTRDVEAGVCVGCGFMSLLVSIHWIRCSLAQARGTIAASSSPRHRIYGPLIFLWKVVVALSPVALFILTRLLVATGPGRLDHGAGGSPTQEAPPPGTFAFIGNVRGDVRDLRDLFASTLTATGLEVVGNKVVDALSQSWSSILRVVVAFCIPLAVMPVSAPVM